MKSTLLFIVFSISVPVCAAQKLDFQVLVPPTMFEQVHQDIVALWHTMTTIRDKDHQEQPIEVVLVPLLFQLHSHLIIYCAQPAVVNEKEMEDSTFLVSLLDHIMTLSDGISVGDTSRFLKAMVNYCRDMLVRVVRASLA